MHFYWHLNMEHNMTKLKLKDFLNVVDFRVTDSGKFLWPCYGENALALDSWNGKHDKEGMSIHCIFDTETTCVYEMQAWDYSRNREYRWIDPDYVNAYHNVAKTLKVDTHQSIDDRKFIDLEVAEDIIEKATAIFNAQDYDSRIIVPLDLTEQEELTLMRAAHQADMSVNEYVENVLKAEIEKHGKSAT